MVRRLLDMEKAKLAMCVMGGVLVVEVIGYIVMMSVGITVPSEYLTLMLTTLTMLGGVAGAQYLNGKIAHS